MVAITASLYTGFYGVLTIIAGLLVLIWPKLIRWALGLYLIIVGILQFLA